MSATIAPGAAVEGRGAIILAALMASFMQSVALSLPNAALLYLQGTLSMADDEVGWIFTSYITASAVTLPVAGWLAGRYGRKTVYQIAIDSGPSGPLAAPWMMRAATNSSGVSARVASSRPSAKTESATR